MFSPTRLYVQSNTSICFGRSVATEQPTVPTLPTVIKYRIRPNIGIDVWLTQALLTEIYQTSKSNVSEHIKHIFEDGELDHQLVVRKFRTTTQHDAR